MEQTLRDWLLLADEAMASESYYFRAEVAQEISEVVSQLRGSPYPVLQDLERAAWELEESLSQR
jgi:hypothetical protein